ncbi:unnamed protein product [Effrenium voratum]|nr:unnamed protein product [Effrenium voratum]|mmetsp:Transcript_126578/g.300663  ORF Transcript_126578/g.300663 Transcript_126578/m.300663 type:complete len:435 (+) Transcript_126578:34-1338(+)
MAAMAAGQIKAPVQAFNRVGTETMLTDIWETPDVLRKLLQAHLKGSSVEIPGLRAALPAGHGLAGQTPLELMAKASQARMAEAFSNRILVIGSGTSWHAALLSEYLIEYMARIPVEAHYASEFRYRQPTLRAGDVVFVVSMSGETTDAVESLREVRKGPQGNKLLTAAVVNNPSSTLAKECDFVIDVQAGPEIGVAATKSFSATGFMFELLSLALARECGTMGEAEMSEFVRRLQELPDSMQEVLEKEAKPVTETSNDRPIGIGECPLWDIGCQNVLAQNFIFLGRGFNFPVALEGAMKCKELAYIHAEGYPAAEMKHGPIALIDEFMPVVVVCPRADATYEKIKANIEEVKARNGATIAITEKYNDELEQLCEYVIGVPETHEYLMPLLAVLPLQLLAYIMGVLRGNAVDRPRGLVKTVSEMTAGSNGYATSP